MAYGEHTSSPEPPIVPVDDFHGTRVADPYRWLEQTDSEATRRWVRLQADRTRAFLESRPCRPLLERRLEQLFDYERFGVPVRRGEAYVYTHNDGLQDQSVVLVTGDLSARPRVLLDPNGLSDDGSVCLARFNVSHDGRYLAYGLSRGGSDWQEWHVREVSTGRDLPDRIRWVKFSGAAWTHDGQGFFYGRYREPASGAELEATNYHHEVYYHRLGTDQSRDVRVYRRPDRKELGFAPRVTDDGNYLALEVWDGSSTRNGFAYLDVSAVDLSTDPRVDAPVVRLLDGFDASWRWVGNEGPVFWFLTDHDAPKGRLVAIDLRRPEPRHWREVLPEADDTLVQVRRVGDAFFAQYLHHAHSKLYRLDLSGRRREPLPLPKMGTVLDLCGGPKDREAFFVFTGFATPPTVYRYDLPTRRCDVIHRPEVSFDPERYVTRQVFIPSSDDTRIPMFLTHRRDVDLDGDAPVLLYGYGGFSVSVTPTFSPVYAAWMDLGGVYAVANVRGGGEYGEQWHQAATGADKQRSFDDFLSAARWLTDRGITRSERLAVAGGSNGGLLVGASLTQRPDLFGAAVIRVGVLDMLRFHKFTVGWAWTADYGSPDDPDAFRSLYAYSPYHNVRQGTAYPATLITTADHDDRVVPIHSFKFAAALQEAQAGDGPILLRIENRAGHGAGTPVRKRLAQAVDELTFLVENLDVEISEAPVELGGSVAPTSDRLWISPPNS